MKATYLVTFFNAVDMLVEALDFADAQGQIELNGWKRIKSIQFVQVP